MIGSLKSHPITCSLILLSVRDYYSSKGRITTTIRNLGDNSSNRSHRRKTTGNDSRILGKNFGKPHNAFKFTTTTKPDKFTESYIIRVAQLVLVFRIDDPLGKLSFCCLIYLLSIAGRGSMGLRKLGRQYRR